MDLSTVCTLSGMLSPRLKEVQEEQIISNGLLAETEKFPAKVYNMNYTVVVT